MECTPSPLPKVDNFASDDDEYPHAIESPKKKTTPKMLKVCQRENRAANKGCIESNKRVLNDDYSTERGNKWFSEEPNVIIDNNAKQMEKKRRVCTMKRQLSPKQETRNPLMNKASANLRMIERGG
jgi:hypothetical protein